MRRVLKETLYVGITLFFSVCMFICFMSGCPGLEKDMRKYTLMATAFSILMPVSTCVAVRYILYLQNYIETLEKRESE